MNFKSNEFPIVNDTLDMKSGSLSTVDFLKVTDGFQLRSSVLSSWKERFLYIPFIRFFRPL